MTMRAINDFTVGWVCALPVELAAARVMLDEEYPSLPQPATDTNNYTLGRIGPHDVVMACLPAGQMGNNQAAHVASQMRSTFPSLRTNVLVGIGGGVPSEENDIRLGDVVISQPTGIHGGVVQYDFGRTGPNGRITRSGSSNAPPTAMLTGLAVLRARLSERSTAMAENLRAFSKYPEFACPGHEDDTLYIASSRHVNGHDCTECSRDDVVQRAQRVSRDPVPFFGNIASGNQVMRDGSTRDRYSEDLGTVLCFEMEAAGLVNNFPALVIRGICDYADAHKNKKWQHYAAATAVAWAKALLAIMPTATTSSHGEQNLAATTYFVVPFGRNRDFVGRDAMLQRLLELVPPNKDQEDCQRTALEGLGGVGKTQIALEAAYHMRRAHLRCSIFWVSAASVTLFENAYRAIGQALGLQDVANNKGDIKLSVKEALERSPDSWVLVIDSADDVDVLFGDGPGSSLSQYLPFSRNGSILFTTRNREVSIRLKVRPSSRLSVSEMSEIEATDMLKQSLQYGQTSDAEATKALLEFLAYLPLAIKQASAYLQWTGISVSKYLEHCRSSDHATLKLLSRHFEDKSPSEETCSPVATTWFISFKHIEKTYPLAAKYLKFLSYLAEKDIPAEVVPPGEGDENQDEAIGILKGYAFLTERRSGTFDIHRLVRLAMRNWVKPVEDLHLMEVLSRLAKICSRSGEPINLKNPSGSQYLRHVEAAMETWMTTHMPPIQRKLRITSFFKGRYVLEGLRLPRPAGWKARFTSNKILLDDFLLTLSNVHQLADFFLEHGKFKDAERCLRHNMRLRSAIHGDSNLSTLYSHTYIVIALYLQEQVVAAEHEVQLAMARQMKALGPESSLTILTMWLKARISFDLAKYEEALQIEIRLLEIRTKTLGDEHIDTISTQERIASTLKELRKFDDAERYIRNAVRLRRKVQTPEHRATLESLRILADVLRLSGKYAEAENICQQVLENRVHVLGTKHKDTFESISDLSDILEQQGKHEEVQQRLQETLNIKAAENSVGSPEIVEDLALAVHLLSLGLQGQDDQRDLKWRELLAVKEQALGPHHVDTILTRFQLALELFALEKFTEAEQELRDILAVQNEIPGLGSGQMRVFARALAETVMWQGRLDEAEKLSRKILEDTRVAIGREHPETIDDVEFQAHILKSRGQFWEAEKLYRHSLALRQKTRELGDDIRDDKETLIENLVEVLLPQEKFEEAEKEARANLATRERLLGPKHVLTTHSQHMVSETLAHQRKIEAIPFFARFVSTSIEMKDPGDPEIVDLVGRFNRLQKIMGVKEMSLNEASLLPTSRYLQECQGTEADVSTTQIDRKGKSKEVPERTTEPSKDHRLI